LRNGTLDRDAVCDYASAVEVNSANVLTLDAGLWRVDFGVPYGTNVHYQGPGMAAAAPVMAATLARLDAGHRGFVQQATTLGT
jgi:hypothetical protein